MLDSQICGQNSMNWVAWFVLYLCHITGTYGEVWECLLPASFQLSNNNFPYSLVISVNYNMNNNRSIWKLLLMHLDTLQKKGNNQAVVPCEMFKVWQVHQYWQWNTCTWLIILPRIGLPWPFNCTDLKLGFAPHFKCVEILPSFCSHYPYKKKLIQDTGVKVILLLWFCGHICLSKKVY